MARIIKEKPLDKLDRNTLPDGHEKADFKCFGPVAEIDGQFESTKLCDLMCFNQSDESDNNKFFHAAVVQSTKNGKFYLYTQWGRLGVTSDFQFQECKDECSASKLYCQKLHDKNDKRGEWVEVFGKKTLKAKAGKDLYLVRPQTVRKCGLPDAKNISNNEQGKGNNYIAANSFDAQSEALLKDLNLGASTYTRSTMVDESLPSKSAIDEVRDLLDEATKILNKGNSFSNNELNEITRLIYNRIPRRVERGHKIQLTPDLVYKWQNDLVAYEAALSCSSSANIKSDYNFKLKYIDKHSELGMFINAYFMSATANRHAYINRQIKLVNIWEIDRDKTGFNQLVKTVKKTDQNFPEFQPKSRQDLDKSIESDYNKSGTYLLIHGTRSINVGGILQNNLRLPKTLSNVRLNNQYYGAGIYVADDYKKSYGFTSARDSIYIKGDGAIKNRNAFMFLGDIVCGNMHLVKGNTDCNTPPNGLHTIFAKAGYSDKGYSKLENNEFVIFNTDAINLRYLLEIE